MKKIIKLSSLFILFISLICLASCSSNNVIDETTKKELLELVKTQISNTEGCKKIESEMTITDNATKVGYTLQSYEIGTEITFKEQKYTLNSDPYGDLYLCEETTKTLNKDEIPNKLSIEKVLNENSFISGDYSVSYGRSVSKIYGYLTQDAAKEILGLTLDETNSITNVIIDVKCNNDKLSRYNVTYKIAGKEVSIVVNYNY